MKKHNYRKSEPATQRNTGAQPPTEPAREDVAALAQCIYEAEGCPDGRAEDHWFEAERRLRSENPALHSIA